ncbi:MAG: BlaI/MecI/CopY family transcriptional regulator [Clostridiales Family XIII bacterium]|jgi:predicted transcriptional regulator|nr:BlaI/MecI/CopY family transcriptional regulator [Clostridiales Family XIII bacterium]
MADYRLAKAESRFADLIWEHAPIHSPKLAELAVDALKWKKTTTYTVLKKLCDKGIFKNEYALVTALVTRDEFYAGQSVKYVDDTYDGSLPRFIAAFTSNRKLTDKQAVEIKHLIDEYRESGGDD